MSSTDKLSSVAFAVWCNAPRAGTSQTRLAPPLTHAEAAALSTCLIRDTLAHVAAACAQLHNANSGQADLSSARGVVLFAPEDANDEIRALLSSVPEAQIAADFLLLPQRGADSTTRLINAAQDLFARGFTTICLMNADSPALQPAQLANAAQLLIAAPEPDKRLVIIPATDAGICLLGFNHLDAELFVGINWQTTQTLTQILTRSEELNFNVELLPAAYHVDDEPSLQQLCAELGLTDIAQTAACRNQFARTDAPHTRVYLEYLILRGRLTLLKG